MRTPDWKSRLAFRAAGAILPILLLLGCSDSEPQAAEEHGMGEEHDALMAQDAEAEFERRLAAAEGKPPVLELDDIIREVGPAPSDPAALARPIAALNASLLRLVELHAAHDAATSADSRRAIDAEAYALHLEADRYEAEIDRLLTPEQHARFHSYLEERAAAVGLPLDDSHGAGGTGTMGNLGSVGHVAGEQHGDTTTSRRASP